MRFRISCQKFFSYVQFIAPLLLQVIVVMNQVLFLTSGERILYPVVLNNWRILGPSILQDFNPTTILLFVLDTKFDTDSHFHVFFWAVSRTILIIPFLLWRYSWGLQFILDQSIIQLNIHDCIYCTLLNIFTNMTHDQHLWRLNKSINNIYPTT